jgi:hypothetical protein
MFGRTRILLMIATCALAMPAAAQAPAPTTTAFDGTYAGISREVSKSPSAPRAKCPPSGALAPLTIKNGVVVASGSAAWEGTVSPQGVLLMRNDRSVRVDGQIDPQGTIRAQYGGTGCITTFVWQKKSK